MTRQYIYKLLTLGTSSREISTFLKGFYRPSEGFNLIYLRISVKTIKSPYNNKDLYVLQLWELKNNKIVKEIFPQLCEDAKGVLIFVNEMDDTSLKDLQGWLDMITRNAGNIPIILIELKRALLNKRIKNETIDIFVKNFKLNRIYFQSFNNYCQTKFFRQVIKCIEDHDDSNHSIIFFSNEFEDFKRLELDFSIYSTC